MADVIRTPIRPTMEQDTEEKSDNDKKNDNGEFVAVVINDNGTMSPKKAIGGVRRISKKKKGDSPGVSAEELGMRRINGLDLLDMDISEQIKDHLRTLTMRIKGHTVAAEMYEKRDKIIGYPITVLSAFTTWAITSGISSNSNETYKLASLSLSAISFILSVTRDYLAMGKKSQSHDLSAKLYANLLKNVNVRLYVNNGGINDNDKKDIFRDILEQMSVIESYELPIPMKVEYKLESIEINDIPQSIDRS